jgi:hypothetical protein
MCTPDMMDAKGEPDLNRARLTTEQANALREARREGGHAGTYLSPIFRFDLAVPRIGRRCRAQRTREDGLAELGPMPGRTTRGYRCSQAPLWGLTMQMSYYSSFPLGEEVHDQLG